MAFLDNLPYTLRSMFDEGLDEILIFAFIFILVLLSKNDSGHEDNAGILPFIIIAAFLLLFAGICRTAESPG